MVEYTGRQVLLKDENGEVILPYVSYASSGRNIGDIFYTSRLDTELNGAVECNGGTYNTDDFTGSQSIGNLLSGGNVPYVSLSEYESIVTANGSCRAFGWDGGTSFRVPLLNDVYIEAGIASSAGEFIKESLPNITGTLGVRSGVDTYLDGVFSYSRGDSTSAVNVAGTDADVRWGFDASRSSSTYQNGAKVKPDSVRYRAMVQLAITATEDAVITATSALQQITNTELKIDALMNNIYPVGSVYLSTTSTCPLAALISGSTWEQMGTSLITSVNTSVPVKGTGKTLGLTDGTTNVGMSYSTGSYDRFYGRTSFYNIDIGTGSSSGSTPANTKGVGVTTDSSKSGIVGTVTRTSISVYIFKRTA